ncbi:hypothetical protein CEXT_736341 [Caerostris extrusa]|uniref:Uncharacterized protein n=1 Tax=Caerostris extrusa TaxID=172846 RepID=A0AAV4NY09_CAEEX|nr:hypothetical protein CEXT_736341 [Caerostris extrusa]
MPRCHADIRFFPVRGNMDLDLLRPQEIDPRPVLLKETHLIGYLKKWYCAVVVTLYHKTDDSNLDNASAAQSEGLDEMQQHDLPDPMSSDPSKDKKSVVPRVCC